MKGYLDHHVPALLSEIHLFEIVRSPFLNLQHEATHYPRRSDLRTLMSEACIERSALQPSSTLPLYQREIIIDERMPSVVKQGHVVMSRAIID
jgi:hypothetical protein